MHAHPRVARPALALLTSTAFAVAGCGGSSSGQATATSTPTSSPAAAQSSAGGALMLQASPTGLKYDKSTLSAKAGKVTIEMTNPSSLQHDVAIDGNGVNVIGNVVGKGGTSTVSTTLKPGTYTFYCSVDAHRAAGMEGTLTVK